MSGDQLPKFIRELDSGRFEVSFSRESVAIHPVEVSYSYSAPQSHLKPGDICRTLVIPDPQFGFSRELHQSKLLPFHDRHVLDLALQIAILAQMARIDELDQARPAWNWHSWI